MIIGAVHVLCEKAPIGSIGVTPPLAIPPRGGEGHFDMSSGNGGLYCGLLFFLCQCRLSEMISCVIQTQMYATGTHVWYHSCSKGAPLLATVIGPSPSGLESLHFRYQGIGDKAADHIAAKMCRLRFGGASTIHPLPTWGGGGVWHDAMGGGGGHDIGGGGGYCGGEGEGIVCRFVHTNFSP